MISEHRRSPTNLQAIKSRCILWNGRYYWLAGQELDFGSALRIAGTLRARLLTIGSAEEEAFVRRTWPAKNIRVAAWRRFTDLNPRTGWVDERLRPLKYFGEWSIEPTDGYCTCLVYNGVYRYSNPGLPATVVLEWGEE